MGHSNGRVGRRYTHALMSHLADDAAALDAYLSGVISGKVVQLAAPVGLGQEAVIGSAL